MASGRSSSGRSARGNLISGRWRKGWGGVALATAVGVGSWSARGQVDGPPPEFPGSSFGSGSIENVAANYGPFTQGLHTHIAPGDNLTSLVVVDAQRQTVAVYHISHESGAIELKSARKIRWDLELTEYNSSAPLPEDIRKGLARQR